MRERETLQQVLYRHANQTERDDGEGVHMSLQILFLYSYLSLLLSLKFFKGLIYFESVTMKS